jgi:hypothetical protein
MRDEGVAYHITGLSEPRLIGSGPPESGRSIGVGAPVGVNGGRLECFQCARGRTATGLARIARWDVRRPRGGATPGTRRAGANG